MVADDGNHKKKEGAHYWFLDTSTLVYWTNNSSIEFWYNAAIADVLTPSRHHDATVSKTPNLCKISNQVDSDIYTQIYSTLDKQEYSTGYIFLL